jgi:hypothetical protein
LCNPRLFWRIKVRIFWSNPLFLDEFLRLQSSILHWIIGGLEMDLVISLSWLTDFAVFGPPRIRPC